MSDREFHYILTISYAGQYGLTTRTLEGVFTTDDLDRHVIFQTLVASAKESLGLPPKHPYSTLFYSLEPLNITEAATR